MQTDLAGKIVEDFERGLASISTDGFSAPQTTPACSGTPCSKGFSSIRR